MGLDPGDDYRTGGSRGEGRARSKEGVGGLCPPEESVPGRRKGQQDRNLRGRGCECWNNREAVSLREFYCCSNSVLSVSQALCFLHMNDNPSPRDEAGRQDVLKSLALLEVAPVKREDPRARSHWHSQKMVSSIQGAVGGAAASPGRQATHVL